MPSVAEMRIRPAELSFRVLQMLPEQATPQAAAGAVERFLQRKRPALARALEIEAGVAAVVLRARGELPHEMLREARELLESAEPLAAEKEIEVDPAEFVVEVGDLPEELAPEREILRSRARYFPFPVCEWFEISTGALVLSNQRIVYEPEWVIMQEDWADRSGRHVIPLDQIEDVQRGEWWDIPCLMVQTSERTYRYGWPARRGEPKTIFDVGEWLELLRDLLQD